MARVVRHALNGVLSVAIAMTGSIALGAQPAAADPGGIVISEIFYKDPLNLDDHEWFELTNTGSGDIDISGWRVTDAVVVTMPAGSVVPAGGRYVVAATPPSGTSWFATTYGFTADAYYTGKLSNNGESVTLVDSGGSVIDKVVYGVAAPWSSAPAGTGPSLELRGLMSDNTDPDNWGASTVPFGTPRAVNTLDGTAPPPVAKNVSLTPARPDPAQAVVISAKLPLGSTASLFTKVMFGAETQTPFLDDAASPGGAGDGVYAATIPGQSAGALVRYRLAATDASGAAFAVPQIGSSVTYEGYTVTNPAVASNLPVVEWFMEDSVYADALANHRYDDYLNPAVIAYDGQVFDNATMRIKGQSTRSMNPVSWNVELPGGRLITMRGAPYPMDEFNINREPEPIARLAWAGVKTSGTPRYPFTTMIRTQRNGNFHNIATFLEGYDNVWRDKQSVGKWAVYKGDGGSLTTRATPALLAASLDLDKKTRESEDYTDVWQLTQAVSGSLSPADLKAWLSANVNVPELVNYMAVNAAIRHTDSGAKNWYVARDTEGTGRWEMWHWDLNWTFTTPSSDSSGTFMTPEKSNMFLAAMLSVPEYRQMYFRRLRTLADQLLVPGKYEDQFDAMVAPYAAENDALQVPAWGSPTMSIWRTIFGKGLDDRRSTFALNTMPFGELPTAPKATPTVVINEINYAPAGTGNTEFLELTNTSDESVDMSGWVIDGIGLTIQPGTVLLPGARVVFVANDVDFRARYGGSAFIGGQYSGALADEGETITVRDGSRVVDSVTYSPADPWPTAAAGSGSSLELSDPTLDNDTAASWGASADGGSPGLLNGTVATADVSTPAPPTATDATSSTTGVTVTWSGATDDRAVTRYQVLRNGALLATVGTVGSYVDKTIVPNSSYVYTVRAKDLAGNVSADGPAATVTTGDIVALLDDGFDGTPGAPWSADWSNQVVGGSTTLATVDPLNPGDTGGQLYDSGPSTVAQAKLIGVQPRVDSEVLMSYRWRTTTPSGYLNIYTRGSGGWQSGNRPANAYAVMLSSSSRTATVRKVVNNTVTTLASVNNTQVVGTGKQWVRVQTVGSSFRFRTWTDGSAEPTTWNGSYTDTSVTAPGQLYLTLESGSTVGPARAIVLERMLMTNGGVFPDTTAPTAPTGLTVGTVTGSSVALSWTASTDNRGVTGYRVFRDGTLVGSPTSTSFTDTGLTAATSYVYTVKAVDAAANVSAASAPVTATTSPAPTNLFEDAFTGLDGAAWASQWTTTAASGGSVTLSGNAGKLAFTDTANAYARALGSGMTATADGELKLSYSWPSTAAKGYLGIYLRGSGAWTGSSRPTNGYGIELNSSSTTVSIMKVANGTTTALSSVSSNTVTTTKHWLRLRVKGSTIQYKIWLDGAVEPTAWTATVTDTSVTTAGKPYLGLYRSSTNVGAKSVLIDDLTVTAAN